MLTKYPKRLLTDVGKIYKKMLKSLLTNVGNILKRSLTNVVKICANVEKIVHSTRGPRRLGDGGGSRVQGAVHP